MGMLLFLCSSRDLSGKSNLLLSFEIGNHALAHISGAAIHEDVVTFDDIYANTFSKKADISDFVPYCMLLCIWKIFQKNALL